MHVKIYAALLVSVLLAACATQSVAPSPPQGANADALYITDGNKAGFSIYQKGRLVNAPWENGYLTYRLTNGDFTIRTRYKSLRIYLAEKDAGEFRQSKDTKLNVLSSVLSGASESDSDTLFVADHTDPLSSNNSIDSYSGLKKTTKSENSYEVRNLYFLKTSKEISVSRYAGTLYAYAWVDLNGDHKIGLDEVSRIKLLINTK
ncbi:lipoprotein, putative [Citrifermentans bemidjiense Bem]|uniref:Lipoprotein, putative n=1 Tax=Citrifermentans bemidjiense (strain ATCC BAA-1014 / DSM 16622 / JCM 12645 / Bem) TaxID=404380 RepID=B5EBR1_CITBB|nr:hypothetical protein [Citrifermentans bemidjiense]ACH38935.1 lipoprotein, putative [Citrifermentans bemidjiense Bem]